MSCCYYDFQQVASSCPLTDYCGQEGGLRPCRELNYLLTTPGRPAAKHHERNHLKKYLETDYILR